MQIGSNQTCQIGSSPNRSLTNKEEEKLDEQYAAIEIDYENEVIRKV